LLKAGDPETEENRQVAKVADYGFPGGMGAERFIDHAAKQGVELKPGKLDRPGQLDESWRLKRAFLKKWPCVDGWFDWVSARTEARGHFTFQHFVSQRLRGEVGYTDGCNGAFQGLVADGAKAAVWDVAEACYVGGRRPAGGGRGPLYGSRPVLFLHDEIIIEVPCGDGVTRPVDYDHLTMAAGELARLMVAAMEPYIPDLPVKAEPAAMRRWYKGAKTIRDDQGRLQIWKPKPKAKPAVEGIEEAA
jgi:DNA polymerase-1